MKIKGHRVDPDGTRTQVELDSDRYLASCLEAMGYDLNDRRSNIRPCFPRVSPNDMFLSDDDSHAKKLADNPVGTKLYGAPIFGTIVIFDKREFLQLDAALG